MSTQSTKVVRVRKPKTIAKPAEGNVSAAPKATVKAEKVAKPSVVAHTFSSSYAGPSGPLNARPSKTPINFGKFGTLLEAALTDRDRKSLAAIRDEFNKGKFARSNVDAGVLRRLGERGLIEHVAGSDVAPDATFKLTGRAFSAEAMQA